MVSNYNAMMILLISIALLLNIVNLNGGKHDGVVMGMRMNVGGNGTSEGGGDGGGITLHDAQD